MHQSAFVLRHTPILFLYRAAERCRVQYVNNSIRLMMKTPLFCVLSLLALGGVLPVAAESAPVPAAAVSLPAPTIEEADSNRYRYYSRMEAGYALAIDFPVPMIADSAVGDTQRPEWLRLSHADVVETQWVSHSRLQVTVRKDLPVLQVFRVEVPEGVTGRNGERLPACVACFPTSSYNRYSSELSPNGDLVIHLHDEDFAGPVLERLREMYYEMGGERRRVAIRPATVGDALANWELYNRVFGYNLDDELKNEAGRHPAEEELKNTWVAEIPAVSLTCDDIPLMLPRAEWNSEKNEYDDEEVSYIRRPKFSFLLTNRCRDNTLYDLTLSFGLPAAAETPEALLGQFKWTVRHVEGTDKDWQPLEWRDGALHATVQDKEVVITPGDITQETLRLSDGSTATGCKQLALTAQTGGLELRVHLEGIYEGIAPHYEENPPENTEDVTVLRPRVPYIYTDVNANHLQMRGSTTIRCRYGRVTGGHIRIWKLRSEGADVARLLTDYQKLYTGTKLDYWEEELRRESRKAAGLDENKPESHRLATENLPGVVAMAERALPGAEEGELKLPLAELFPQQPVGGFYLVEVEGTPLRGSKYPCFNQGLVQVTDLGLLWKTNGSRLFAWAYHLSTAGEVESARLRLMDKDGGLLAELPVQQGIAEGDFPTETRFLQLVTEDDSVTVPYDVGEAYENDYIYNQWRNHQLMQVGIAPASLPRPMFYLFTDRSLYRPGETAHLKGIVRWLKDNQILLPEVESIKATVWVNRNEVMSQAVEVQPDGTFTLDVPTETPGNYMAIFNLVFKGDADESSPDKAVVKGIQLDAVTLLRSVTISWPCKEFRRNEFEVESKLQVHENEKMVTVEASAVNFTTTPVAGGKVQWSLRTTPLNFYPKQQQWFGFRFGEHASDSWEYFYNYYHGEEESECSDYRSSSGTLDEQGCGKMSFALPQPEQPFGRRIESTVTVTNGNEQSIRSVQRTTLHPAAVYGGIRPESGLVQAGGSLPVELVAVKPDGAAWDGAPLSAEIKVKRTVFRPYRYGSFFRSTVRNVEDETTERCIPVSLTGTPQKLESPVASAGRYDIELRGRDADGREFYSSTCHYVWGDDTSPWEYLNGNELKLLPDKERYSPGDTARVLVQTPVDAELLVTVERGGVLRHFRRVVTVANPVLEVPVEASDAPLVYVSVSLVQNGGARSADGKPLLKLGTCRLAVEPLEKKLELSLSAPQKSLLPGDECRVSGVVTDADGKPVANADVTLYAEDEGTLQVMGYRLPDPLHFFYGENSRALTVETYSAQEHLVSENLGNRYFGNKGVFIGGGDDGDYDRSVDDAAADYLRKDFDPCALWLGSVRTDAEGRFSAVYTNPDTLTRYRLMAVASAGDKFGAAESSYHVTKPIMLEPAAPMSAAAGDEVLVPVTLSMLPEELPEAANNAAVRWQVSISGTNVELPQPSQTVSLSGKAPVTIHFPVKVKDAGPVSLRWSVQAASASPGSVLSRSRDAVELSFEAVLPTPHIREHFHDKLMPGQSKSLGDWVRGDYRPESQVELTFSTSPLAGLEYPLNYLFTYPYGCSEQLCSTALPWLMREELQALFGIHFPEDRKTDAVLADVESRLQKRQLPTGGYRYWDGDANEASDYSPYVVMVRSLISGRKMQDIRYLKTCVNEGKGNDYLALLVLTLMSEAKSEAVETVLNRARHRRMELTPQQKWTLALTALMTQHPEAPALRKDAETTQATEADDCHLPPLRTLQCLYAAFDDATSPATEEKLRQYVMDEVASCSTWRSAWMALTSALYAEMVGMAEKRARVNGNELSAAEPYRCSRSLRTGRDRFSVQGNPVYVYGKAEGYLRRCQPEQLVDKGFDVQRRYECLQADGSWKPTGQFRVGDVVRVTVTARATGERSNLRYIALEDRLPAVFEVVDPELSSQALPEGIKHSADWWSCSAGVTHREYLKDRVRAFSDNRTNRDTMKLSYVARVVRSGKVTAPAAKVELMYRPEVHGLSIPHQFEVQAR